MNLNMTVGQAACRLLCRCTHARWLRPIFAESYRLLRVNQAKELWLFVFEMHLIKA